MAGNTAHTNVKACTICLEQATKDNHVTASLALRVVQRPIQDDKQYLYKLLKVAEVKPVNEGPGTELKKLISWFVWNEKDRNCSTCKNREQRMNRWGPDNCEKNMATIVGWLKESAVVRGYPFSERVAVALIKKAITNSRRK